MEIVLAALAPWVETLSGKYGIIVTIVAWVGTLRMLITPTMALAKTVAGVTETTKDDEVIKDIETSKYYSIALNIMEWLTSLDLKKKEVVKVEPKVEPKTTTEV